MREFNPVRLNNLADLARVMVDNLNAISATVKSITTQVNSNLSSINTNTSEISSNDSDITVLQERSSLTLVYGYTLVNPPAIGSISIVGSILYIGKRSSSGANLPDLVASPPLYIEVLQSDSIYLIIQTVGTVTDFTAHYEVQISAGLTGGVFTAGLAKTVHLHWQ